VYFGTINRMIFAELVKVFIMALIGLTGMFLLAGLIQEATQKGLSPLQILFAIPLIIPNTLPFTIPATTLFATCVVYGRMSADNEVLVLRAAGVDIYHLLWPALLLGVCTTAVTAALYYEPIPKSQTLLRNQLLKDGENILYGMIKREGGLRQANLDFVLFVRDVQGKDLIDVVVKKRKPDRLGYELVARSQTARIRIRKVTEAEGSSTPLGSTSKKDDANAVDPRKKRMTKAGGDRYEIVVYMDHCFVDSLKGETAAEVRGQEYTTPLPESIFGKDPKERPSAQTWQELLVSRVEVEEDIDELHEEIRSAEARMQSPDENVRNQAANVKASREYGIKDRQRMMRQIDTEMHMRPALALGCLCFVLIGCPVGIWASRSDYLSVFIICFMPTVFVYYPLLLAGLNLAKDGKLPAATAWLADALGLIASVFLIKRLMKR
jgi:lipopolysaccharide export system permease protein